ncbi:Panacea domain-containing protein [Clostridium butyricum]|uniref:Panacea domain-containing protein n=1 Tax=Clostridium butyricum TaxID=1492 RepID=UPI00374E54DB
MKYKVMDVAQYVINYSIENGISITNLKLQKLLYYIQAAFLVEKNGESCFIEAIENWRHGPVVDEVYKKFKKYASDEIEYLNEYSKMEVTDDFKLKVVISKYSDNPIKTGDAKDRNIIKKVIKSYENVDPWDMVERTHQEDPWKLDSDRDQEITIDSMLHYFNKSNNKDRIYYQD